MFVVFEIKVLAERQVNNMRYGDVMRREDRAKQFMPFDALKGLREAFKLKEEQSLRVEKSELTEENIELISKTLLKIAKGSEVCVSYYNAGRYDCIKGIVKKVDKVSQYIVVDDTTVFFDDIYSIKIN